MIRQAQSYLAGAASSAALVGAAVAAFVLLASLQAFRNWPIAGLGDDSPVVALAREPAPVLGAPRAFVPALRSLAAPAGKRRNRGGARAVSAPGAGAISPSPSPVRGGGGSSDGSSNQIGVSGGRNGSSSPPPADPTPTPPRSSPAPGPGLQLSGVGTINAGLIQGTVHQALQQAGEAAGGVLGQTGLPGAVQGVTDGALAPGSPVGQVVDGTLGTANGIPHGSSASGAPLPAP